MKFTFEQLKAIVTAYVNPTKIGSTSFDVTKENLAGLIDKIGLIVTLDGKFYDKLAIFDGEDLPLGKTVEEYYQDLLLPQDYDSTGANTLAPAYPTYRPATYSYSLGEKTFKTTIKYNTYERACNNMSEYADLVSMVTKRLSDSVALYYFNVKKQAIGVLANKLVATQKPSKQFTTSTAYEIGEYVKKDTTPTKVGVVMKKITSGNAKAWEAAVADGLIVELDLVHEMAVPVDTATCEDFIEKVKEDVETASFATEGYSLNGNTVGAEPGLVLLLKKGIIPKLEVRALAGAFHSEKLALPAEVITVDDFGSNTDCFAILVDRRAIRVHNDNRDTREQENGEGNFINLFRHTEDTVFISLNTFSIAYKIKAA